jgi:hypothetical protein
MGTEMDDPRTVLTNVIKACKVKFLDLPEGHDRALADAIADGLERRGLVIAEMSDVIEPPDEHLRTLKNIRRIVNDAVVNGETPARDLASLTRRLQDVSREVTTIEERHRGEKLERSRSTHASSSNRHTTGAAEDGSLRI